LNIYIKSPLNYIGGKYKILPQILPHFPANINCFVDLFAGGANVGINIKAKKIILNDNLIYLIDLYEYLSVNPIDETLSYIEKIINKFQLTLINTEGFNNLRIQYNKTKKPLDLLILSFYSFNHQIRFNSKHDFNTPFGKNRSQYNKNIKKNLIAFINILQQKNITFMKKDFDIFNFLKLTNNDFVYCDPPYLITTGTYNDGKRGFNGWNINYEKKLLDILDNLNRNNIKFALSNVLTHKNQTNTLLNNWLKKKKYNVYKIKNNFTNSNYHTGNRNKETTQEVLINNF